MEAIARFDWGRWIAECPNPACNNAMQLERGQTGFRCRFMIDPRRNAYGGCGATATVVWPADPDTIERGLAGELEGEQNWRPA